MWGGFFDRGGFDAQEILDGVWLGSYDAARAPLSELQKRNIAFVLTVGDVELEPVHLNAGVTYLLCRCEDEAATQLLPNFDLFHEFIAFAREKKQGVLVHCMAGISRSTTTLVSYMMKTDTIDFETAMARVRQHRRFVCPNMGFERQLRAYEHVAVGKAAAKEPFLAFAAKPSPKVTLARLKHERKVEEPSHVRTVLDELYAMSVEMVLGPGAADAEQKEGKDEGGDEDVDNDDEDDDKAEAETETEEKAPKL